MMTVHTAWGTDIGSAVSALRSGHRVRRAGWNAPNQWLSLTPGNVIPAHLFWSPANRDFAESRPDKHAEVRSYVTLKTADDKIVPWTCSQSDLLATDWEVLPL